MLTRRLVDAINILSEQQKTLEEKDEQKFEWLDARVSALESRFNPKH